jgi:ribosomal protein S18 acetylase RimI-like enzyme
MDEHLSVERHGLPESDARIASFVPGSEIDRSVVNSLSWLYDASNPYWDWFWGGPEIAREQLTAWTLRASSELSLQRTTLLVKGQRVIGGYIAVKGDELAVCRQADLFALLRYCRSSKNDGPLKRVNVAKSAFPLVAPEEYYLSRIGVENSFRGMGYGRQLLEHFIAHGTKQGHKTFCLNVTRTNSDAVTLYTRNGFHPASSTYDSKLPAHYVPMKLEID